MNGREYQNNTTTQQQEKEWYKMTNTNKAFIIEIKTEERNGILFNTENVKKFQLNNSENYPITPMAIKEVLKVVKKEIRKNNKHYSFNHMWIDLYTYDCNFYTKSIKRYTFDSYNGVAEVSHRPYKNGCFGVEEVEKLEKNVAGAVADDIENMIYQNITVKPNSENKLLASYGV